MPPLPPPPPTQQFLARPLLLVISLQRSPDATKVYWLGKWLECCRVISRINWWFPDVDTQCWLFFGCCSELCINASIMVVMVTMLHPLGEFLLVADDTVIYSSFTGFFLSTASFADGIGRLSHLIEGRAANELLQGACLNTLFFCSLTRFWDLFIRDRVLQPIPHGSKVLSLWTQLHRRAFADFSSTATLGAVRSHCVRLPPFCPQKW